MEKLNIIDKEISDIEIREARKAEFLKQVLGKFYDEVGYKLCDWGSPEFKEYEERVSKYQDGHGVTRSFNPGDQTLLIIPFEDACRLMFDYKITILDGKGFVQGKDIEKVIKLLFERIMRDDIKILTRHSDKVLQIDERFESLIQKIPHMYTGKDYSSQNTNSTKNKINLAEMDALASKNFPLCMSEVFSNIFLISPVLSYKNFTRILTLAIVLPCFQARSRQFL